MPDAAKGAAKRGAVTLSSYAAMAQGTPFQGGAATARFTPDVCNVQTMGKCSISDCATTNWVSAGAIMVKTSAATLMLDPGGDNSYPTQATQTALYTMGETITVSGAGGVVPAFSGTLTAPGKPTLTSPLPQQGKVLVDRSRAFAFTWTGGGSGDVWITMSANGTRSISCRFAASSGSGSIPSDVLGALPAGMGSFGLSGLATTTKDAGDWEVTLQAFYSAVYPDGTMAAGQTTLQ